VQDDLQIAFYQLQRYRLGNLSREDWLWLFDLWCDHDRGQQVIDAAERDARLARLCKRREELLAERAVAPPQRHASLTARLAEIGRELAELQVQTIHPGSRAAS
jgi:hypothetical protein